jgi:hypothetical protein
LVRLMVKLRHAFIHYARSARRLFMNNTNGQNINYCSEPGAQPDFLRRYIARCPAYLRRISGDFSIVESGSNDFRAQPLDQLSTAGLSIRHLPCRQYA